MLVQKSRSVFQRSILGSSKFSERFLRFSVQNEVSFKGHDAPAMSSLLSGVESSDFRKRLAPWLAIGHYEHGLISHLRAQEILRATSVLYMCRFDRLVERSQALFNLSRKVGLGSLVRCTFFDQFVGGETLDRMDKSVKLMRERGLRLMLLPVVEADISEVLDQRQCELNLAELENLVRLTAKLGPKNSIFQLKPSAFISPTALESVSNAVAKYKEFGDSLTRQARLIELFSDSIDKGSGALDEVKGLTATDKEDFVLGLQRADKLAGKLASELSVQILVDAEFVSWKEAINLLAQCLMARYNGSAPRVGNTTQAYLKGALTTVANEWDLMQNVLGVHWAGKVVRGAYMVRESEIARQLGRPSPVWSSYEETNRSYNSIIAHLLEKMGTDQGKFKRSHLTVASHNERSIRLAAHLIKHFHLDPASNSRHLVSFAQIYGMADYLSTPLVRNGHPVYKSTPYGPMESVLPYLSRRAVENRSVIQGARLELEMLTNELKSRIPIIRNFKKS